MADFNVVANPVLIEVTRGPAVECRHRGAVAVADSGGAVIAAWGDVEAPVFPRSAVKPLQAIALVETGAAERFGLGSRELALACASHIGQERHTAAVTAWLERLGLGPADLECGPHMPIDRDTAADMVRSGTGPGREHNNCSGKHAGILTTVRHMGEPTAGYRLPDHPAQGRLRDLLGALSGADLETAPCGIDGCGIPTYAVPLSGLARAAARFARPDGLGAAREGACRSLAAAMRAHPYLVRGDGGFDTNILARATGSFIVKTGAEGVYLAADPERGLGIAVKIDDGASRASQAALTFVLRHLGIIPDALVPVLLGGRTPARNTRGEAVGAVRPASGWPE